MVETFGLVPQSVFPESFNSSNSSKVDGLLTTKLREYALELRELTKSAMRSLEDLEGKSYTEKMEIAIQSARKRKVEQVSCPDPPSSASPPMLMLAITKMEEVYRILAITLGTPLKPEESFTWEYYSGTGKDKKFNSVTTTPLEFYHKLSTVDVSKAISLINDPRNKCKSYIAHNVV